jgi:hypothetical protein
LVFCDLNEIVLFRSEPSIHGGRFHLRRDKSTLYCSKDLDDSPFMGDLGGRRKVISDY